MDLDRPMTKNEIKFMFGLVVAVFIGLGFYIYSFESSMKEVHAKRRAACQSLNLSYGQSVTVKEGFYKDVPMTAVGMGEETVEVQFLKGLQLENARFLCEDLVAK